MNEEQIIINNEYAKPHPFLAGLIDFYLLSITFSGILAIIEAIMERSLFVMSAKYVFIFSLITIIFTIAVVVLNYKVFADNSCWLSPGEIIAGRTFLGYKKVWINPYKINRWGIFFIVITTLIILGNEWDRLFEGYIFTYGEIFGKATRIILIVWGLIMLGRGRLNGIFILLFFFLLGATLTTLIYPELGTISLLFYGTLSVIYILIYVYYRLRLNNK